MANENKTMESKALDQHLKQSHENDLTGNNIDDTKANKENNEKKVEDDDLKKDSNFFQKTKRIISLITVEPILACYVMPSVLSSLATQNLYLEKACRVNLQFEDHVCDALTRRQTTNYTVEEEAVQTLVATVQGWKTVLQSFLPCVLLIFLGAYSDRIGKRKFCMLLPIVGEFLTSIGLMVNTFFFYQLPVEVAGVTEAIFPAVTGGWFTMFMGVFSYIADITTEEERTVRIGVVNLFYSLGIPVGAALSGILVRKIGLYGVFSLSASLYVVSFLYGFFRIKEVKKRDLNVKPSKNCCDFLQNFFDISYVKETLTVAFKRGTNKRRIRVILLVVVLCILIGPIYGEMSVTYLFTRYRFNWDEVDYSLFSTYAVITSLLGTLFSVTIFSYVLKLDDALVGVISCTSKILSSFMYAFATKSWHFYIAPLIEIFNGASFIAMRSMISKLVPSNELGKVMSLFGVAEAMMPLVYTPMYTMLYAATIKYFPGAFFLLGGALILPAVVIFTKFHKCTQHVTPQYSYLKHSYLFLVPITWQLRSNRWMYLLNKRCGTLVYNKNGETEDAKTDTNLAKSGIENKAFEQEDISKKKELESETAAKQDTVTRSQIEMGITDKVFSNSKL